MSTKTEPRLKTKYREEVAPQLREQFAIKSVMAIPQLKKITLNMGIGRASKKPR